MDQRVYLIGATTAVLAPGATAIKVQPSANQVGWILSVNAGGGSGVGLVNGYGVTASAGVLLGSAPLKINGPAEFFLVAQGTTAVVGLAVLRSAGFSTPIA